MEPQTCQYNNGKCMQPRATKNNGTMHTLCELHRTKSCATQRKSDAKRRNAGDPAAADHDERTSVDPVELQNSTANSAANDSSDSDREELDGYTDVSGLDELAEEFDKVTLESPKQEAKMTDANFKEWYHRWYNDTATLMTPDILRGIYAKGFKGVDASHKLDLEIVAKILNSIKFKKIELPTFAVFLRFRGLLGHLSNLRLLPSNENRSAEKMMAAKLKQLADLTSTEVININELHGFAPDKYATFVKTLLAFVFLNNVKHLFKPRPEQDGQWGDMEPMVPSGGSSGNAWLDIMLAKYGDGVTYGGITVAEWAIRLDGSLKYLSGRAYVPRTIPQKGWTANYLPDMRVKEHRLAFPTLLKCKEVPGKQFSMVISQLELGYLRRALDEAINPQ